LFKLQIKGRRLSQADLQPMKREGSRQKLVNFSGDKPVLRFPEHMQPLPPICANH